MAATAALVGAWTAFLVAILARVSTRLGIIDLISYEIIAICRVISTARISKAFLGLYQDLSPKHFADTARGEVYVEHFHRSGKEIGDLNRYDAARITEFYTYLKGSRDATRSLDRWQNKDGSYATTYCPDARREDVNAVLYQLYLALEAACYVVRSLRSREEFYFVYNLIFSDMQKIREHLLASIPQNDQRHPFLNMERRTNIFQSTKAEDLYERLNNARGDRVSVT